MATPSFLQHLSLKEKWSGAHLLFWWVHHTRVVMCCLLSLPGCSQQGVEMAENIIACLFLQTLQTNTESLKEKQDFAALLECVIIIFNTAQEMLLRTWIYQNLLEYMEKHFE